VSCPHYLNSLMACRLEWHLLQKKTVTLSRCYFINITTWEAFKVINNCERKPHWGSSHFNVEQLYCYFSFCCWLFLLLLTLGRYGKNAGSNDKYPKEPIKWIQSVLYFEILEKKCFYFFSSRGYFCLEQRPSMLWMQSFAPFFSWPWQYIEVIRSELRLPKTRITKHFDSTASISLIVST